MLGVAKYSKEPGKVGINPDIFSIRAIKGIAIQSSSIHILVPINGIMHIRLETNPRGVRISTSGAISIFAKIAYGAKLLK